MNTFINTEDHQQNLGSKASNLLRLKHLNVPRFFVIPFNSLKDLLDLKFIESVLVSIDFEIEEDILKKSKILQDTINNIELSDDFMNELNETVDQEFDDTLFSVRSSSSLEDQSNFAFAGQFDTFLNVEKK